MSKGSSGRLRKLRKGIDKIDGRILGLLNKRLSLASGIAKVKRSEGLPAYAPDREAQLVRALVRRNRGPISVAGLRSVYREILSASRAAEEPVKVAYFGPEATWTHLAARERFGSQAQYIAVGQIADVFYEVDRRKADYGVVPVENSTEGVVNYTLDMFIDSELKICAEDLVPVSHMLLSAASSISAVRTVYSHQQVLAQCRHWLEDHMHAARQVEVSSSAEAARIASRDRKAAAIGTELAAKLYGLNILARSIEDMSGNCTRFFVVSKSWSPPTGRDKTSVIFSIKDRVGALYTMLQPFRRHGINLTSIESRPSRRKAWDYYFFLDMVGHIEDRNVAAAVRELERQCVFIKLLGSYPAAEPVTR